MMEANDNWASCHRYIKTHVVPGVTGLIPNASLLNESQDLELNPAFTEEWLKRIEESSDVISVQSKAAIFFSSMTFIAATYGAPHRSQSMGDIFFTLLV